jgi:hypothetical protein
MKKQLLLIAIAIITPFMLFAWGDDVPVNNVAGQYQGPGDIAVAFNGWTYIAYSFDSGITIRETRDHGNTWNTVDSYYYSGTHYPAPRIVVAGTDTASLRLYLTSVNQRPSVPSYTLFVDEYKATTHAYISSFSENSTSKIYSSALATDYLYPAVGASPYSLDLVFAKYGSRDSIISLVSTDGSTNFTNRQKVANTTKYFRNVSVAYGRSQSGSNGRYFLAWDEYDLSNAIFGHIYTARNTSFISSAFTTPVNLDSLDPGVLGYASNPSISASISSMDNDSSGVTALVVFDRAYNGQSADHDILGFSNMRAHFTDYWNRFDIDNSLNNTVEPAIGFDSVYNNFLVTYYDTSNRRLPYTVHNWQMTNPSSWSLVRNNYADDSSALTTPWPRLAIDPTFTQAAFTWALPGMGNSMQMFEGEYRTPRPVITSLNPNNAHAGDPGFTLTVNGYDFVNTSVVMWDATALSTTYVNSTQLTAPVSAAMIANYGNVPVTVVTPPTLGGGTSNADTFHILFNLAVNSVSNTLNTVSLFPNPANDHIDISYSFTEAGNLSIVLYDMSGRAVKTLVPAGKVSGNSTITANVADLPQGVYQAVIQNGTKTSASKIVISH